MSKTLPDWIWTSNIKCLNEDIRAGKHKKYELMTFLMETRVHDSLLNVKYTVLYIPEQQKPVCRTETYEYFPLNSGEEGVIVMNYCTGEEVIKRVTTTDVVKF